MPMPDDAVALATRTPFEFFLRSVLQTIAWRWPEVAKTDTCVRSSLNSFGENVMVYSVIRLFCLILVLVFGYSFVSTISMAGGSRLGLPFAFYTTSVLPPISGSESNAARVVSNFDGIMLLLDLLCFLLFSAMIIVVRERLRGVRDKTASKVLTAEIAEQFLADEDSVDLSEFTELSDAAAESLTRPNSQSETQAGDPIVNSISMRFVSIPAGTFTMGDANGDDNETPHQVTLTKPFELGVYEVTQEQYERVMGENPSHFKGAKNPVERVSWEDAVEFCRKLSALPEEKAAGRVYRLPTEAEWGYACRAGTTTKYSFGDEESQLSDYAWYRENSDRRTHPVGQKKPNAWGLYDMHGNVWEWCQDRYGEYPSGSVTNPTGPSEGSIRVYRGGGWFDFARYCQSGIRIRSNPRNRYRNFGFRVAQVPLPDNKRASEAESGSR